MAAFATREQYDARFPGRTAPDAMLDECLEDASAAIRAEMAVRGALPEEADADALMRVCRSVANRIMPSGADVPIGVTQMSTTAGPYSQTMSYTPSYGTPKLLPSELKMLGLGGGRAGWARAGGRDD